MVSRGVPVCMSMLSLVKRMRLFRVCCCLLKFLVPSLKKFPFNRAHPVKNEKSVEVVYLVLEYPCKEPCPLYVDLFPGSVKPAHIYLFRPLYRGRAAGDTETAFRALYGTLVFDNQRVYEDQERAFFSFQAGVYDT